MTAARTWVCLALVVAVALPSLAEGKRRQRKVERGAELRAVRDAAEGVDALFVPVHGPVVLEAAIASYDPAAGTIVADGDVVISFGDWVLACEHVSLDLVTEEAVADGACTLTHGDMVIEFASASIELSTLEGLILEMRVDGLADRYRFEAGSLHRTSDGQVFVHDGWFTPCGCGGREPAWSIRARYVRITPDGSVHHRRGWFCLGRKRVLPVPSGRFDGVTGRSSGFLLPQIRFGGSQPLSVALPLYLATSRNTDVTVTPTWYDTRGLLVGAEFRYAIAPGQGGFVTTSVIDDRSLLAQIREQKDEMVVRPEAAGYSHVRFWGQWRHYQRSRHGVFGAHVDVVRDDMILRDFEQDYGIRRLPYLVSSVWAGAHGGRAAFRAEAEIVDDLADVRNGDALHTLPRLTGSVTRLTLRPHRALRLSLDVGGDAGWHVAFPEAWDGNLSYKLDYADIGRDGLRRGDTGWPGRDPDRSEDDSHYNQGEPVYRTLRGAVQTRLAADWAPGGWFWWRGRVEAEGTLYGGYRYHKEPGALGTVRLGSDLGTALYRDFEGRGDGGGVRHVIEPLVQYELQPFVAEKVHPILTYDDLQWQHHRLALVLVNRLQRSNDAFMRTQPRRQALELRVAVPLEFDPEARFDVDKVVEPARLELAYRHPFGRIGARTALAWEEQPVQTAGAAATMHHRNGNRLVLAYDWVRGGADLLWAAGRWYPLLHSSLDDDPIHELTFGVTWVPYTFMQAFVADRRRIVRGFELAAQWRLDLRRELAAGEARLHSHEYSFTYTSPCACWRGGLDLRFASDWESPSFGVRLDLLTR